MNSLRTLKLIIAGLLVAIMLLLFFNPLAKTTTTEPSTIPTAEVPINSNKSICMDYEAEKMSTLDADLIHVMTQDYMTHQLNYIQTNGTTIAPKDARSIWFDLVTLKKYLYHIEKNSKKVNGTITEKDLGVRIYYATYPDKVGMKTFDDLKDSSGALLFPEYEGLHTLVMIPTIADASGNNLDFNPLDDSTFTNGFYQDSKYAYHAGVNIPNNETAALSGSVSRGMGARNHGTLSPPNSTLGLGF